MLDMTSPIGNDTLIFFIVVIVLFFTIMEESLPFGFS